MRSNRAFDRYNTPTTVRIGLLFAIVTALFLGGLPASHAEEGASRTEKPVRGMSVTATLASLPPIVAPGTSPAAPGSTGSLLATFSPAAPGQRVVLEKKVRGGWKVVATAREDAWGSAAFSPGRG